MALKCSIGVVTYLGRFESYFKPLMRQLGFLFPDYDLNVFINGHYDTARQVRYLRSVTTFLRRYRAVRYVTNLGHQPLARGWNRLVMMARHDRTMILNDDVSIRPMFRRELEGLGSAPEVFTINGSWSHFVIAKGIVRCVGWFDERFAGVGDEDGDYMCRLAMNGIPTADRAMRGIHNHVAEQEQAGWANLSGVINGKYTRLNREVFLKKWFHSGFGEVPEEGSFRLRYKGEAYRVALKEGPDEMPEYYPMAALDPDGGEPAAAPRALLAKLASAADCWRYRIRGLAPRAAARRRAHANAAAQAGDSATACERRRSQHAH